MPCPSTRSCRAAQPHDRRPFPTKRNRGRVVKSWPFRLNFSTGGRRGRITPKGVTEILTDTRALLDTDLDRCAWHVDALVGSRLADAGARRAQRSTDSEGAVGRARE